MENIVPKIEYPSFSELSEDEKATVIELILKHFGRRIETFKYDGQSHREIQLTYLDPAAQS
jgi:hypothetical protein